MADSEPPKILGCTMVLPSHPDDPRKTDLVCGKTAAYTDADYADLYVCEGCFQAMLAEDPELVEGLYAIPERAP